MKDDNSTNYLFLIALIILGLSLLLVNACYGENLDSSIYSQDIFIGGKGVFKSFMFHTSITSRRSKQYQLQKVAVTGNYGIRMVDDRYCIAVSKRIASNIGVSLDVYLTNGSVIPCVLADCKKETELDETKTFHPDGSVIEFVVDKKLLDKTVYRHGSFGVLEDFKGGIEKIAILSYER